MSTVLGIVRKFFPEVTSVEDAVRPIKIAVSTGDTRSRAVKDHNACAMAVACKRSLSLDGVIISRSTAYLVKGRRATRYKLPSSVSREVVSFDRGAGFAPGDYVLSAVPVNQRLGMRTGGDKDEETGNGRPKQFRHLTTGVRTVLGGKDPDDGR